MKSRISILILATLLLAGCQTEMVLPSLPDYAPIRPTRPTLETVEEEVPMGAVMNTVKLMSYAEQMEAYADGWEDFYGGLQDEWH